MSYSQWGTFDWSTFWAATGPDEDRDSATLRVDCKHDFTAKRLREDVSGCLDEARKTNPHGDHIELLAIIGEFLDDVDLKYPNDLRDEV